MLKKHSTVLLSSIFLFIIAGLINKSVQKTKVTQKVYQLHEQTGRLKAIVKVDAKHANNINKVLSVINRFNPNMPLATQYAITKEICDAALKYANLDVDLICATITHESAFSWNPEIVSPAGAMGLMQVMPETGKFLAKIEGLNWDSAEAVLFNPVYNIRLGSKYLSKLIEMYQVDGGLAAYNGGGRRAEMWLAHNRANGVLFKETQNYVPAVLSLYDEFRIGTNIN